MTSVPVMALVAPPTSTISLVVVVVELPNSEVVSTLLLVVEVAEIVPASTAAKKGQSSHEINRFSL